MEEGRNVILEIEVQGAMHIKDQYPEAVLIFLTAPSGESLRDRLVNRGTEEAKVIAKRLKRAYEETEDMEKYDYLVINDNLDNCVATVNSIIIAESCKTENNINYVKNISQELFDIRKEF